MRRTPEPGVSSEVLPPGKKLRLGQIQPRPRMPSAGAHYRSPGRFITARLAINDSSNRNAASAARNKASWPGQSRHYHHVCSIQAKLQLEPGRCANVELPSTCQRQDIAGYATKVIGEDARCSSARRT